MTAGGYTGITPAVGPVRFGEQAAPSPEADAVILYGSDQDGNTVLRAVTPEGYTYDPHRDIVDVVRNASGATLAKGAPVHASGVHPGAGSLTTVAGARADSATTLPAIGVMAEATANNSYGRMMSAGRLEDVDTSAWSVGDILWLSATVAGGLTTTPPSHPFYLQPIAQVLRSHATTGILYIRVGAVRGAEIGTAQNTFAIGNAAAGTKTLQFKNAFTGSLQATPTAARTWTLPDASGAVALAGESGWLATDSGLAGWTFDPQNRADNATLLPSAGLMKVVRIRALSSVITNILLHFTVGGSSLSNCYAALYNDAGALLGAGAVTADQSTAWQSSGLKTCALNTPQAVTRGDIYRIGFWWNGTTAPTASRGSNAGSTIINVGQSASTARFATANSGLTNSAPSNLSGLAGDGTAWWVGIS